MLGVTSKTTIFTTPKCMWDVFQDKQKDMDHDLNGFQRADMTSEDHQRHEGDKLKNVNGMLQLGWQASQKARNLRC